MNEPRAPAGGAAAEAGFPGEQASFEPLSAPARARLWFDDLCCAGQSTGSSYIVACQVFLRALGLVYLAAFLSLWPQLDGLVGSRGIMPAGEFLRAARHVLGAAAYARFPTVLWAHPTDGCLHALCGTGIAAAALLILGVLPLPALVVLWGAYLSLTVAGQIFLGFPWDALLLETGFLAIFLAPLRSRLSRAPGEAPPRLARWLLWWLLFRLMFSSGLVKLASNDETWWNLSALQYYYWTQPLPTWIAWYANLAPAWFHRACVFAMFCIELGAPFLIIGPRRARYAAFAAFTLLQTVIAATGNFAFFNLLTFALGLPLLDDAAWPAWIRRRLAPDNRASAPARPSGLLRLRGALFAPVALGILLGGLTITYGQCLRLLDTISWRRAVAAGRSAPAPHVASGPMMLVHRLNAVVYPWLAPFHIVGSYGLFEDMTTRRLEISVEGSDDGVVWQPYVFAWKPGAPGRRPAFVAPHQPRLDWQFGFAAAGTYRSNPWLFALARRLLEGEPAVLKLLASSPYPAAPPRAIRLRVEDRWFTDVAARRASGAWWQGRNARPYCPGVLTRDTLPPVEEILYGRE